MFFDSEHPGDFFKKARACDTHSCVIDELLQSLEANICSMMRRISDATLLHISVVVSSIVLLVYCTYTCFYFRGDTVS